MCQICKELKEINSDIKCQLSSETNYNEDIIDSIEDHNFSVVDPVANFVLCDPLPLLIDPSPP